MQVGIGGTENVNSMQIFPFNSKVIPSIISTQVVNNGQNLVNVVCERPLMLKLVFRNLNQQTCKQCYNLIFHFFNLVNSWPNREKIVKNIPFWPDIRFLLLMRDSQVTLFWLAPIPTLNLTASTSSSINKMASSLDFIVKLIPVCCLGSR